MGISHILPVLTAFIFCCLISKCTIATVRGFLPVASAFRLINS